VCGDWHKARALDVVIRACKTSKSIGRCDVPYSVLSRSLASRSAHLRSNSGQVLKTAACRCIQSLEGVSMTDSEGLWPQLIRCAPHLSMVPLISDKVQ
jgi:hypothetical protein